MSFTVEIFSCIRYLLAKEDFARSNILVTEDSGDGNSFEL